jgi:hypothetical protein
MPYDESTADRWQDWAKEVTLRKLPFDVAHQVTRLRSGQGMSHAEAEAIFETLASTTQSHEQVLEVGRIDTLDHSM